MDKCKSSPSLNLYPHNLQFRPPAHDPFNLILITCLILGCGTLLAYNALVSCATYFNHQFPSYPSIEFTIVPVFSIPNLVFIILMIPFGDRLSWNVKILGCFSLMAVLVLSIPYVTDPQWNIFGFSESGGYYAFLVIVALIGCVSAVIQCSITAFCGLLPQTYLQTVLAGQSVSGILVCVIRVFSKLLLPLTPDGIEKSGKLYFMVSSGVCIVCALSFYYARHSEFVRHHVTALNTPQKSSGSSMQRSRSVINFSARTLSKPTTHRISLRTDLPVMRSPTPSDAERIEVFDNVTLKRPERVQPIDFSESLIIPIFNNEERHSVFAPEHTVNSKLNGHSATKSYGAMHTVNTMDTLRSAGYEVDECSSPRPEDMSLSVRVRSYGRVFMKVKHLVASIWLSMCFTFLWFPGVIVEIPSSFAVINDHGEWLPIIMILEFNVFDYIGRQFLCNVVPSWLKQHDLWKISLCRMVTYPVFIVFLNQWVVNDVVLHCMMIVSALSNGYVASLSFMWFPENVRKNEQQIAASLMTLGLIMGILSGSMTALVVQPYVGSIAL